jgi:hypothetical protein
MKATLQKHISMVLLGVALFLQSLPTWAGLATRNEVYIQGLDAQGSMAGARYSADSTQYISCQIWADQTYPGILPRVYCSAADKVGRYAYCSSTDPRYVDAVKMITDFSHIYFTVRNNTRTCTDLVISNESVYLP